MSQQTNKVGPPTGVRGTPIIPLYLSPVIANRRQGMLIVAT